MGQALPSFAARLWLWLCEGEEGAVPCTITSVLSSSIWAPLVAVHVYLPRSCWLTLWRVRILESSVCVCRDRRSGSITARCVCGRWQKEGVERKGRKGNKPCVTDHVRLGPEFSTWFALVCSPVVRLGALWVHEQSDALRGLLYLTVHKSQSLPWGENTAGNGPPHRFLVTRAVWLE